ncbi:unnamed protein product [Leptidea sinapis]|uniref:Uncharacterized protein n=1 Tax=Leptidea sinapis TaxID=189913 RepID=A0A5E4QH33_9NEOP|nr:unnamed protein product [Leptidea sinapis]
MANGVIILSW